MTHQRSYEVDLWDGMKVVYEHYDEGKRTLKEMLDFFKERASIEESLAKSLSKTVKAVPSRDSDGVGTINNAWYAVRVQSEGIAKLYASSSTSVSQLMVTLLTNFKKEHHKSKQQLESEVLRLNKELEKSYSGVQKIKQKYFSTYKDAGAAKAAYDKGTSEGLPAKDMFKLRGKMETMVKSCEMLDTQYQLFVKEHQTFQAKYEQEMKRILQQFQQLEEKRCNFTKEIFEKYVTVQETINNGLAQNFVSMKSKVQSIDWPADVQMFLEQHRTNLKPPPLLDCEQPGPGLSVPPILDSQKPANPTPTPTPTPNPVSSTPPARDSAPENQPATNQTPTKPPVNRETKSSSVDDESKERLSHTSYVVSSTASPEDESSILTEELKGNTVKGKSGPPAKQPPIPALSSSSQHGTTSPSKATSDPAPKLSSSSSSPMMISPAPVKGVAMFPFAVKKTTPSKTVSSTNVAPTPATNPTPTVTSPQPHRGTLSTSNSTTSISGSGSSYPAKASNGPAVKASNPPASNNGTQMARASFDYVSEEDEELQFKEGDLIKILKMESHGWWTGELNGKVGIFPGNYVELINEPKAPVKSQDKKCKVLFDFKATASDELTIKEGEVITIVTEAEGWMLGLNSKGEEGLFPANFVAPVDA